MLIDVDFESSCLLHHVSGASFAARLLACYRLESASPTRRCSLDTTLFGRRCVWRRNSVVSASHVLAAGVVCFSTPQQPPLGKRRGVWRRKAGRKRAPRYRCCGMFGYHDKKIHLFRRHASLAVCVPRTGTEYRYRYQYPYRYLVSVSRVSTSERFFKPPKDMIPAPAAAEMLRKCKLNLTLHLRYWTYYWYSTGTGTGRPPETTS